MFDERAAGCACCRQVQNLIPCSGYQILKDYGGAGGIARNTLKACSSSSAHARIARFARAQNRLPPILSNTGPSTDPAATIPKRPHKGAVLVWRSRRDSNPRYGFSTV